MKLKRVTPDDTERGIIPGNTVDSDSWVHAISKETGIVISYAPEEGELGGVFVPEELLLQAGYIWLEGKEEEAKADRPIEGNNE